MTLDQLISKLGPDRVTVGPAPANLTFASPSTKTAAPRRTKPNKEHDLIAKTQRRKEEAIWWSPGMDKELRQLYQNHTRHEIAEIMGLREAQVRSRLHTLKLAEKVIKWTDEELKELRDIYTNAECTKDIDLDAFAKKIGKQKSNVCRKARNLGLTNINRPKINPSQKLPVKQKKYATDEERNLAISERMKKYFAINGHPRGALGMKHTDESKKTISKKSAERWASLTQEEKDELCFKRVKAKRDNDVPFANHKRGSWKAAWRVIGGQRNYFRSRWEANYARYLEWLRTIGDIQSWEHEAHTFWFEGIKRGCVSYLPDFKVTNKNGSIEWHEVKGWMDARSKTVIARMAKYHPEQKLVVIGQKEYESLRKKLASVIPDWES